MEETNSNTNNEGEGGGGVFESDDSFSEDEKAVEDYNEKYKEMFQ